MMLLFCAAASYFWSVSYQVFARKYRPQIFDDVLGQDHVVRTLKNAITEKRLAHAYLFVGPRGTGKTSTARILAKALNCVHGPTVTPCGVCDSCREISQGISLDVLEIDGASNNSVDQVRELRDNVRFAPVRGRYKIYIIDEVHMLTSQAFNALLKTLEEPPAHVIFVFATTEPNKVLPTILSRCQRFDLRRIPAQIIAWQLESIAKQENVSLSIAAAEAIAIASEGGLRDAESMLDQLVAFCGNDISEDQVLEIFGLTSEIVVADLARSIVRANAPAALRIIHDQAEAGKDLSRILGDLIGFLRHLLIDQVDSASVREELSELGRKIVGELSNVVKPGELLRLIEILSEAEPGLKWTTNKKLHLEIAIIRAIQSLREVGFDRILGALENLANQGSKSIESPLARSASDEILRKSPPGAGALPAPASLPKNAAAESDSANEHPAGLSPEKSSEPDARLETVADTEDEVTMTVEKIGESEDSSLSEPAGEDQIEDLPSLWIKLLEEVRRRRPLIQSWVEVATPLGRSGAELSIGFPASERLAMESLLRPNNRKFVEELLTEIAAAPRTIRAELRDDLVRPTSARRSEATLLDGFKNDPLIQKALEIFRAEIEADT
jgi:DNA polymerase III subunit gamma/tau